jgi:hypothetical protein
MEHAHNVPTIVPIVPKQSTTVILAQMTTEQTMKNQEKFVYAVTDTMNQLPMTLLVLNVDGNVQPVLTPLTIV